MIKKQKLQQNNLYYVQKELFVGYSGWKKIK